MRTRTPLVLAVTLVLASAAIAGFTACTSSPMVSVYRLGVGDKSEGLQGDTVKSRRPPQDSFAGAARGYWIVRTREDWNKVWPDGQVPVFPPTLDPSTSMAVVVVPDSRDAVDVKVTKIVESSGFIHVWVRETMRGDACMAHASDKTPVDALYIPRIEKPVKFYVEEARGESCGDPPATELKCRKADSKEWVTKLEVQPGDLVDCELTSEAKGKFAVVDRALFFSDVPGGSTAKLAYQKGPSRATFRVDAFGTYGLRGEATDESGRKGSAKIEVVAVPPKTKDALVQLVWTNFDAGDDPDTFPRLTLTATAGTSPPRECSLDKQPPDLCEVRRFSAYTMMKLKASSEKVPLSVRYVDERIEKGPLACVHVWFDGARTAEICDRTHRDPDQRWEVGVLDMATGKLGDPLPAGPVDAGVEGGAKKPPAPPAKK
jgi:hypothetical protein